MSASKTAYAYDPRFLGHDTGVRETRLPAGAGNRGYLLALERVVVPVVRAFGPELILISAGQDASMADPLGRMLLTMGGYRSMAALLHELAAELCPGRLIGLQEGGYSPSYVPHCTLGVIEGIAGIRTTIEDSWAGNSEWEQAEREFHPWHEAAVERARAVQSAWWPV